VLLAIVIGLGSGLALSAPLASVIGGSAVADRPSSIPFNPFEVWTQGLVGRDLLLLGMDESGGNTDVIATLRVDGGVTRITQIPRDTYIEAEQFGPVKINSLYALGGVDTIKQEVSYRLGRPIVHHVLVNLDALRHVADLIGGLEIDVPKRMYYVDQTQGLTIDLQPGRQLLRGKDLEGFLRFRHDELGDIGRMERQQLALQALFRKATRPDQLVRLPALLLSTRDEIQTDLGPMELGGLMTAMGGTTLETTQLPGHPFDLNGISYLDVEWPQAESPASFEPSPMDGPKAGRSRFLF
jgi:LCP family protein required for cell wall assembly